MLRPLSEITARPLIGGAITAVEKALLPFGAYSAMTNLRNEIPSLIQRPGQIKQHTTADSTNQVYSIFMFSKSRVSDQHLFAQMSDGDILEATNLPPTVTTGVFGSEVFSGSSGQIRASWAVLDDLMIYSNGADQHKMYAGTGQYISGFHVVKASAAHDFIPLIGEDYTIQVSDSDSSTVAILDSLGDLAVDFDAIYVMTEMPVDLFTWTVSAANGTAAVMQGHYWTGAWTAGSITDNTASGGATLAQSGTMVFSSNAAARTTEQPRYMFGKSGYWYRFSLSSGDLDAETEVSAVTYDTESFVSIQNVWDGVTQFGVEVQVEGSTQWETYGAGAVDLDTLAAGKKIMIAATDPLVGIYFDVGGTPNATGTTLTSIKYFNGSAFSAVSNAEDGTNGLSNTGWITFDRQSDVHALQWKTTQYYAYWYEVIFDTELAADMLISVLTMPYFDIDDFGSIGRFNVVWKDRNCCTFNRFPAYIYVSNNSGPQKLNGNDFGILQAGDGRANAVVAGKRFHNELLVAQEEKGVEGGCLTLFEGYTPSTFGKLVLSSRIGSMNANSMEVVDGVLTATATEETIKTMCFGLSRYGVWATDGVTVSIISDDIQNYFDPTESECIRYGYEQEMWLKYDAAYNVLRIGLVSGASATKCNVFPVFDLFTKTWSFDTPAQELSTMENVEAGSGQFPVLQVGGGIDDGQIYQLNTGTNDVSTAINASFTMELGLNGEIVSLDEFLIRFLAQAAGDVTCEIYENDILQETLTLSMLVERTNETYRRHRNHINIQGQQLSLKFYNNTASQEVEFLQGGFKTSIWENV